jgi:hypothetical protein
VLIMARQQPALVTEAAAHDALVVRGEDQTQVDAGPLEKGAPRLRGRHGEAAIEVGHKGRL